MTTVFSWVNSTSPTFENPVGAAPTIAAGGTYGERMNFPSSTTATNVRKALPTLTDFGCRFVYSLASFATSSHTVQCGFDSAVALVYKLDLSNTGLLRLRNAATTQVAQGTVSLVTGVEYRLELYRSGATLTAKAYRVADGALVDSISGPIDATAVTSMAFGNNAPLTGTLGAFTFDEIAVTDVAGEVGAPVGPLSASMTLSPTTGSAPLAVTSTVTAVGGTGTPKLYAWAWGDGQSTAAQSSNVASHTYSAAGEYDPVCTVTNS